MINRVQRSLFRSLSRRTHFGDFKGESIYNDPFSFLTGLFELRIESSGPCELYNLLFVKLFHDFMGLKMKGDCFFGVILVGGFHCFNFHDDSWVRKIPADKEKVICTHLDLILV